MVEAVGVSLITIIRLGDRRVLGTEMTSKYGIGMAIMAEYVSQRANASDWHHGVAVYLP